MANILDGICPEGSILDGLDDWPRSATRKEWFRITRELVASNIADMDLEPAALAEVEQAFIRCNSRSKVLFCYLLSVCEP